MAKQTSEPRALSAALAAPAFHTRGGGGALHAANRHVERWAPETSANSVRSMRSLGFVDRLVAPWIETAQRSASMRLFSQYARSGPAEREGGAVSWVFPRPWYQDELDWMAAARQANTHSTSQQAPAPTMLTTRGTYVPPVQSQIQAMPSALYEFVAPSLSIAQPTQSASGIGYGGSYDGGNAYSPLVSLAAVQAAELMSRTVAPMVSTPSGGSATVGRISPALRSVLTTMLERAAVARSFSNEIAPTRSSMYAPEMVTPPAPRPDFVGTPSHVQQPAEQNEGYSPSQLADRYAAQRTQIVELQRIQKQAIEREIAARNAPAAAPTPAPARTDAPAAAAAQQARTADAQANAQRIESELRQRAADRATMSEAQARQAQVERAENVERAQVERAKIEEKIATRVAERAGAQRLHEQARIEAAAHARSAAIEASASVASSSSSSSFGGVSSQPAMPDFRASAEVAAAIAGLPPELAAFLSHRPERAMQAVTELNEVLRTAELLARSAASNVPFEATRGPRMMMPAGLGGLVSAVDRAQLIADRPAQLAGMSRPAQPMIGQPPAMPMIAPRSEARVPTLPWLVGPSGAPRTSAASTTALGATASAAPAGLGHVAWADRWLARFAGATPQSLDILQAASAGSREMRMQALAAAAPSEVFVSPMFDTPMARARSMSSEGVPYAPYTQSSSPQAFADALAAASASPSAQQAPALPPAERYDDSAETPDDVFLQIAAAASNKRAAIATAAAAQAPQETVTSYERYTLADSVAHGAPSAPGAGLSAQLASSPFAPALRHVLPLPAAASFDIRALFGAGLSATYLAGLIAPESSELEIAGASAPMWASWGGAESARAPIEREGLSFDPTYVSPVDDRAPSAGVSGDMQVGEAGYMQPSGAAMPAAMAAELAAQMEPLTTLRTALLSWTMAVEGGATHPSMVDAPSITTSQTAPITTAAARAMIESMSLPMLGDGASLADRTASWGAPGMLAERAQGWSVAQERSASDLSLDFVTPELVLAARVYGLGPAEAAQAARLAIAGPGHLTAMAGAVDRTFVQAMAIEADRREGRMTPYGTGSYGGTSTAATSDAAAMSPAARAAMTSTTYPSTAYPTASGDIAAFEAGTPARYATPGAAFGVERRAPRGAFLWPSATVAALGLHAASPDGQQSMPHAALELLAAQAVAEIGTYAALGDHTFAQGGGAPAGGFATGAFAGGAFGVDEQGSPLAPTAAGRSPAMTMPSLDGMTESSGEPGEADVLGAAAALVPASRRARFDALYVALSQSSTGKSWSPASRAARALALAGRGDEATSPYERAATAWDVLPVVYATDGMSLASAGESEPMSTGQAHTYAMSRGATPGGRSAGGRSAGGRSAGAPMDFVEPMISVDARPGLGALSARAGEALGSYVSPAAYAPGAYASPSASSSASSSSSYAAPSSPAQRAPTAAQELVRTGRPSGRFGGGEVEIPSWFETAARKMLEDRSGNSDGISMAELTLVTAAPASHVAASSRGHTHHTAQAVQARSAQEEKDKSLIDIDKTANEVYRQILSMMDAARLRNGQ